MSQLTVAMILDRVPPWLAANFDAASRLMKCVTVESRSHANHMANPESPTRNLFTRVSLGADGESVGKVIRCVANSLDDIRPDVVVTLGWSGARNMAGLSWCISNKVPVVVATDSGQEDYPRTYWREMIKRRVIRLYTAGWAASQAASDYLIALGMKREQVVIGPVDSIDVHHFSSGAEAARSQEGELRLRLTLPTNYFLAVSRFVPEKNIPTLLSAYGEYRKRLHEQAWKLVLVGTGPLEHKIRELIRELHIERDVLLPGHVSFEKLPSYYALAKVFVHASIKDTWAVVVNEAMAAGLPVIVSRQCGATRELVEEGINGFTFDARESMALAQLLQKIAHENVDRKRMGEANRKQIDKWTPETYAASLLQVAKRASSIPVPRFGITDRVLLSAMLGGQ